MAYIYVLMLCSSVRIIQVSHTVEVGLVVGRSGQDVPLLKPHFHPHMTGYSLVLLELVC